MRNTIQAVEIKGLRSVKGIRDRITNDDVRTELERDSVLEYIGKKTVKMVKTYN